MGNKEINNLTKEAIYFALVQIMKNQDYDKITITDVVNRAGVSRMAFYRNYESMNQIISKRLDELFFKYYDDIGSIKIEIDTYIYNFFIYFRKNHELIQVIDKAGLYNELVLKFNTYLKKIFYNTIYSSSTENKKRIDLEIQFIVGGLCNLLISWIRGGMEEPDQEMARIVRKFNVL